MVSTAGVTIQKATTAPGSIARTIALPYGTTSSIVSTSQQPTPLPTSGKLIASSTISTTTLGAIPVARVCPQPLTTTHNLVNISTSGPAQQEGTVFITRTAGPLQQQQVSAINLSTSANGNQFHPVSGNNGNKVRSNMPKINLSMQPTTKLSHYKGQQQLESQHPDQHQRLPTNPPRPSILRRREGERELLIPGHFWFQNLNRSRGYEWWRQILTLSFTNKVSE